METVDLKVVLRENVGGRNPRKLRREGMVPGVVYAKDMEPKALQVDKGELLRALHTGAGENVIVNLKCDGEKDTTVIVNELQHDVVTEDIIHIDFHRISLTEKVEVQVHVHVKGEAKGVRDGGNLDIVHHELTIECLPTNIPERININVEHLEIGDSLCVKDLVLPEDVVCLDDAEDALIVVHPPTVEEEETGEEAELEAAESSSEPEVIKKGKEQDEDGAE